MVTYKELINNMLVRILGVISGGSDKPISPETSAAGASKGCGIPSQDNVPDIFRLEKLKSLDLYEVTIDQLRQYFSSGQLASAEYVSFCLERIRKIDPYLEAIIEVNPDALEIARNLDDERQRGEIRGALHGIPVLVKDNMATKDKMQTTGGSWALLGSVVARDAHVVSQLREAGAVILGHANLSEWAALRSKEYSTGYSPRRGQVRNPFNLSSSPFGSSSGSAVAVSANIVPLSLGTETDTSIIGPALINGVVGIKPTVGLTSRSGVIPISSSLDSVGPYGRTVSDAVHGLNAIVGPDARDLFTLSAIHTEPVDYTRFISTSAALKGAKFGLPWKRCWEFVPEDQKEVATAIFEPITRAGGEVIRTDFPCAEERIREDGKWDWELGEPAQSEFTVVKVEAYNGTNAYLSELSGTNIKTVEDIIAYNEENRGTEGANPGDHPAFASGQDNWLEVAKQRGVKDEVYETALSYIRRKTRDEGIDAALRHTTDDGETVEFDALIMCDRKGVGQQIAAQAGYPIISIPIGLDAAGIPVGITLLHTAWQESALVKWASAIEDLRNKALSWRPTPEYHMYTSKNIPIAHEHTS